MFEETVFVPATFLDELETVGLALLEVGDFVGVGVFVGVSTLVGVGLFVGVGVFVGVKVFVGLGG